MPAYTLYINMPACTLYINMPAYTLYINMPACTLYINMPAYILFTLICQHVLFTLIHHVYFALKYEIEYFKCMIWVNPSHLHNSAQLPYSSMSST